jgi:hypothetical protein
MSKHFTVDFTVEGDSMAKNIVLEKGQLRSLLSYKIFKHQEAFVQWQRDNPEFGIKSVSPLMEGIDLKYFDKKNPEKYDYAQGSIGSAVFVVYFWNEEVQ